MSATMERQRLGCAHRACSSCPYRRDVPPGIWDKSEYEKLRDFDRPTYAQPNGVFMCHQKDGNLCAGWVAVHGMELLGLRLALSSGAIDEVPEIEGDFYASGNEAADAGRAGVAKPSPEALAAAAKIVRRRPELLDD